jgi:hypothetical protein
MMRRTGSAWSLRTAERFGLAGRLRFTGLLRMNRRHGSLRMARLPRIHRPWGLRVHRSRGLRVHGPRPLRIHGSRSIRMMGRLRSRQIRLDGRLRWHRPRGLGLVRLRKIRLLRIGVHKIRRTSSPPVPFTGRWKTSSSSSSSPGSTTGVGLVFMAEE